MKTALLLTFAFVMLLPTVGVFADGPERDRVPRSAWEDAEELAPPLLTGGRERGREYDGRHHGPDPRLTAEELDEVIAVARELDPELADRLEQARRDDPRDVGRLLGRDGPTLRRLVWLRRIDPGLFDLRIRDLRLTRESLDLAYRLRDARAADRDADADRLEEQLEALVERHFEIRQEILQRQLEAMRVRLEQLEEELDERDDDRDDLIEERVEELVEGGDRRW